MQSELNNPDKVIIINVMEMQIESVVILTSEFKERKKDN